jgi:hypothetical protein
MVDGINGLQSMVMEGCEEVNKLPKGHVTTLNCDFAHGLLLQGSITTRYQRIQIVNF